jgi:hypothetical protein
MIVNCTSVSEDEDIDNNCHKSNSCHNAKFIYHSCCHVVSRDLNIVQDKNISRFQ